MTATLLLCGVLISLGSYKLYSNAPTPCKEGVGALAAETAKRQWPLFKTKPKLHMQMHLTMPGFDIHAVRC